MTRKRIIKLSLYVLATAIIIGVGIVYYMFNMPHRNVQETKADYNLSASQIVNEYLANATNANEKYLDAEGDSKIIEITGLVNNISEDFEGNKVVLLKSESDKAGVSCTFSKETNSNASALQIGNQATIKGVIRAGASFDSDLNMYEDVIMEKCDIISNK